MFVCITRLTIKHSPATAFSPFVTRSTTHCSAGSDSTTGLNLHKAQPPVCRYCSGEIPISVSTASRLSIDRTVALQRVSLECVLLLSAIVVGASSNGTIYQHLVHCCHQRPPTRSGCIQLAS